MLTACLEMAGRKYGVLSVLTSSDFVDDEREQSLFKKIVKDVAQGLYSLDLEERHKDVTDALEDSERRYKVLVETTQEGIGFFDRKGKIKFINPAFAENLGYERDDLEGQNIKILMDEDDFTEFKSKILEKKGKTLVTIDTRLKTKTGEMREFRVSASPYGQNGKPATGTIAIMSDITQHKKFEKRLKQSEIRSRRIIDNSADGIVILDKKGIVRFVNPSAEHLFDRKAGDLIGKKFGFPMLNGKTSEIDIPRKGNGIATAEMQLVDMNWEGQEAYLATLRDVTDRKHAAKKLEQSLGKLNKVLSKTIHAMSLICETRDPYTAGHQKRVANLSMAIARALGSSEEDIRGLLMAGEIHDLGKIYVPAEILSKPSVLNENEFMLIKNHPQIGFDILKGIEFPWPVAKIVYQHHERMDGSGYPNGLKGKDILPEAKILAVADVVEAMSSHRPYRPALGIEKALDEIRSNRGKLYDIEVVNACLSLFKENKFQFKEKEGSSFSLDAAY
jgi:PAS domain S-box-containing protein/putative nucleotidyltransferase with HDIG domain